jgi:hypothetical protein
MTGTFPADRTGVVPLLVGRRAGSGIDGKVAPWA